MHAYVIDSYLNVTETRKYELQKHPGKQKPWQNHVFVRGRGNRRWVLLSTAEYVDEEVARKDFETRRPNMRVNKEEVPMQRGKRLVQEMLEEKLGTQHD